SDSLGVPKTEKASQDPAADSGMAVNVTGMAPNVANVEGQIPSKAHPRKPLGWAKNRPKNIPKQAVNIRHTQNSFFPGLAQSVFAEGAFGVFSREKAGEKVGWGVPSPERLPPATLDRLEGSFPRSRFWKRPACQRPATGSAPCRFRTGRRPPCWSSI